MDAAGIHVPGAEMADLFMMDPPTRAKTVYHNPAVLAEVLAVQPTPEMLQVELRHRVTVAADWSLLFLALSALSGGLTVIALGPLQRIGWGALFAMLTVLCSFTCLYFYCLQLKARRRARQWGW